MTDPLHQPSSGGLLSDDGATPFRMGLFLSGWLDPTASSHSRAVDRLLARVGVAESVGFSSVWVGQHLLGDPWPLIDTDVFLGRIAGVTNTMEIGGVYVLPLDHPIRLAESLISLDIVAGGRFVLCAALGWAQREFDAMGVPIGERVGRFKEALHVLKHLWSTEDPLTFDGKHFHFENVRMLARPERPGGIPVWIGASTAGAVRRAARLGDAWLGSSHTPEPDLEKLSTAYEDAMRAEGKEAGRRPLLRHCMVAESDGAAVQRFTDAFEAYYDALGNWGIFKQVVGERHAVGINNARLPPGRAIVGSPATVSDQIDAYRALGFDEIVFQVGLPGTPERSVNESIELLGTEVLPKMASAIPR